MTHCCPAAGCDEQLPDTLVFCKKHWFKVPSYLRKRIWASYHAGRAGTEPHFALIRAATAHVDGVAVESNPVPVDAQQLLEETVDGYTEGSAKMATCRKCFVQKPISEVNPATDFLCEECRTDGA